MLNSFLFLHVSSAFASGTMGVKTRDENKQTLALSVLCVSWRSLHPSPHCCTRNATTPSYLVLDSTFLQSPSAPFWTFCHLPGSLYGLRIFDFAECTQILTFPWGRICSLWLFGFFIFSYFLVGAGYKILILTKKKFNCDDILRKSINNSGNLIKMLCSVQIFNV